MISFRFETQRPVFLLLAGLCCCNCVPLLKTVNMVDPFQSASESSTTLDTARQQKTVVVDLGALLDTGDGDVEKLVAGSNWPAAQRRVLIAENFVSAAMFRPDMLEASDSEIDISGMEGAVLRQLVGFHYTGRTLQLPRMAPQLLPATENIGVSALKDSIEQQVAEQLLVENAAATAVLAQRYNSHSLIQAAVAFIRDHLEVLATQGWAEAVLNHPGEVVQISRLLGEPSTETSVTTTTTDSRPTSAIPVAPAAVPALLPTAGHHTPPPDATAISHLSNPADADSTSTSTAATPAALEGRQYCQPPDATADSLLRSLPDEEKGWLLIQAAREGAVEKVRALLTAGADVDARESESQQTPLHIAAVNDRAAVVRVLLEASANIEARNIHGHTPLQVAAWWGEPEAAAALLNAGADRGAKGNDGRTALEIAESRHHWQIVQMLQ